MSEGGLYSPASLFQGYIKLRRASYCRKDTAYRFKNSIRINWLRFHTLLSARIIRETLEKLTDENRVNVFIIPAGSHTVIHGAIPEHQCE
jgi:hypothetical protein